jgi:acetylornithine deacetylase/succinyl-diaminopimelate desuccinylase-like protein
MPAPDYFISVDGAGESVTIGGVGSHRYRAIFKGPGGHSYGAFGMPNPMHAMGRAIAKIGDFQVPSSPKTTFNVGVARGGTSVNSIAFEASADVDLRSESPKELESLVEKFRSAIQSAINEEHARWPNSPVRLTSEIQTLGIRPAGSQNRDSRIVQAALKTATAIGFEPAIRGFGSTDSNIPISLGIPAVTITGGGRSGGSHSLGEWYEDGGKGFFGPQWALMLASELAEITD